jgi:hypothetical protein
MNLPHLSRPDRLTGPILLILACLCAGSTAARAEASATNATFLARAKAAYQHAETRLTRHPTDPLAAGQFASACFDLNAFSHTDLERERLAQLGIDACRRILAENPSSVTGHYYLAMNLGELAQARAPSLSAYRLVHEVEHEFEAAAKLDERFDQAGPVRNLGELYFQAPSWPLSVGSHRKAREQLELAAALAPGYPENQLNLLEARLKWRERAEAESTLHTIALLWPQAQKQFDGPEREKDWADWDERRAALEAEYRHLYPATP